MGHLGNESCTGRTDLSRFGLTPSDKRLIKQSYFIGSEWGKEEKKETSGEGGREGGREGRREEKRKQASWSSRPWVRAKRVGTRGPIIYFHTGPLEINTALPHQAVDGVVQAMTSVWI